MGARVVTGRLVVQRGARLIADAQARIRDLADEVLISKRDAGAHVGQLGAIPLRKLLGTARARLIEEGVPEILGADVVVVRMAQPVGVVAVLQEAAAAARGARDSYPAKSPRGTTRACVQVGAPHKLRRTTRDTSYCICLRNLAMCGARREWRAPATEARERQVEVPRQRRDERVRPHEEDAAWPLQLPCDASTSAKPRSVSEPTWSRGEVEGRLLRISGGHFRAFACALRQRGPLRGFVDGTRYSRLQQKD